ncbi:DUF4376 domain-containing protein [uncultured Prevotella sp.]|uniref:DUF4376 domain-containing protein n=1 Tax=uncultured Prevotella sp. TaxID=159272 RepID=UPI0026294A26|nr:DUF4376 domain-containing protein [uncultured Prevotella sp.]
MEKFCFREEQPRVTVSAVGTVLLLINGKEKTEISDGMPDENGMVTTETVERKVWEYDGVRLDTGGMTTEAALTAAAQKMVLEKITEWDTSEAVNSFVLDGMAVWIDKDTRMGLRQNIADKVTLGEQHISMWLQGRAITLPCAEAERLMCGLENYAYECYCVTARHKAEVNALNTAEEVLAYDYMNGYPDKIEINFDAYGDD